MTPYRNPANASQKKFNEKHCKLRNVIERVNGVLKNRFRSVIGSRGLHYSPQKTTKIVNASCVLHNICVYYKCDWEEFDIEDCDDDFEDDIVPEINEQSGVAVSIRDEISRNLT